GAGPPVSRTRGNRDCASLRLRRIAVAVCLRGDRAGAISPSGGAGFSLLKTPSALSPSIPPSERRVSDMVRRRWTLLRLFGFEIRFDLTWLILLALIVWSLSAGYFPEAYGELSEGTYLWMAVIGAIGMIASIVIHELSHSLVARRFGMTIRGITLFAFGGAAELEDEPPTARAEFLMAAAGPAMSLVLALLFWLLAGALAASAVPTPFVAV